MIIRSFTPLQSSKKGGGGGGGTNGLELIFLPPLRN